MTLIEIDLPDSMTCESSSGKLAHNEMEDRLTLELEFGINGRDHAGTHCSWKSRLDC
jgi:hypothetical protein